MEIKTIAIAGAGTMGAGIAQVCAQANYKVILFDINDQMLIKAKDGIQQSLNKLNSLGKITAEQAATIISSIQFISIRFRARAWRSYYYT